MVDYEVSLLVTRNWRLSENPITDAGVEALCVALKDNFRILNVDLNSNNELVLDAKQNRNHLLSKQLATWAKALQIHCTIYYNEILTTNQNSVVHLFAYCWHWLQIAAIALRVTHFGIGYQTNCKSPFCSGSVLAGDSLEKSQRS